MHDFIDETPKGTKSPYGVVKRTKMYSQFSLVRFSSVALSTTSSKAFVWARNILTIVRPAKLEISSR